LNTFQRIVAGLFLDRRQAAVHDLLGGAALAVPHQRADELRHQRTAVKRVERDFTLWNLSASGHISAFSFQLSAHSSQPLTAESC